MPLKRLKNDCRVTTWRGVDFWMADETGSLVFCRINREALQGQARRAHFAGTDDKVFEVYQNLLEQAASDAFDADACNEAGCVIVTKEALYRVSLGALGRRRVPGEERKFELRKAPMAE